MPDPVREETGGGEERLAVEIAEALHGFDELHDEALPNERPISDYMDAALHVAGELLDYHSWHSNEGRPFDPACVACRPMQHHLAPGPASASSSKDEGGDEHAKLIVWLRTVFENIRDGKIADPALVAAAQVEGIDRVFAGGTVDNEPPAPSVSQQGMGEQVPCVCNIDSDGTLIYPDGEGGEGCPQCAGRGERLVQAAGFAELVRLASEVVRQSGNRACQDGETAIPHVNPSAFAALAHALGKLPTASAPSLQEGGGQHPRVTLWKTRLVEEQARLRALIKEHSDAIKRARRFIALEDTTAAEDTLAAVMGDAVNPPPVLQEETGTRELRDFETGAAFRLIESALRDPHQHCPRIGDLPRGTRQLEPMWRWQTRALMSALSRLAAASLPSGDGERAELGRRRRAGAAAGYDFDWVGRSFLAGFQAGELSGSRIPAPQFERTPDSRMAWLAGWDSATGNGLRDDDEPAAPAPPSGETGDEVLFVAEHVPPGAPGREAYLKRVQSEGARS